MRESTIDKLIIWGITTVFISSVVFLVYATYMIESVHNKCLSKGYTDAYTGFTYNKSYCIDKYKSIVVPFNKI